jgi:hypothetical protein
VSDVWILDDSGAGAGGDLPTALAARTLQLGVTLNVHQSTGVQIAAIVPKKDDVVVVYAAKEATSSLPGPPPAWVSACVVIPVVEKAKDIEDVRPYLRTVNAFVRSQFDASYVTEVLADDVLSEALLARRTRSVFVSYKRSESLAVARQVAGRLSEEGFAVFLDERSIGRGVRFDREIAYRLDDADMIVVLVTDGLEHSSWVQKEISFACSANIALVAVDLTTAPGTHSVVQATLPGQRFLPSGPGKHDGTAPLDDGDLSDLMSCLYRLRVAGIVRRVQNLLPLGRAHFARSHASSTIQTDAQLGALVDTTTKDVLRVLPFRPTADVLWDMRRRQAGTGAKMHVVYPENVPHDARVRALRWAFLPHRPQVEILHVRQLLP